MIKVTIDPGKGGSNFGAVHEDLIEKHINLNIALKCREELVRHGIQVQMTREDDDYVGFSERIAKGNKNYSDAFISIHCNSGGGALGELIYSVNNERGLKLAYCISSEMEAYGQKTIKIYNRLGQGFMDFYTVIREASMDSVIIKCAFIDNEEDNKLIKTMDNQRDYGTALAKGILNYFNIEYIESWK